MYEVVTMKNLYVLIITLFFLHNSIAENWRLDSRFIHLDIKRMVENQYPKLTNLAEEISHYSGYYNVNPFLIAENALDKELEISLIAKNLASVIHGKSDSTKTNKNTSALIKDIIGTNAFNKSQNYMRSHNFPISTKTANQANMPALDFPFDHSKKWHFNGIHTWTGDDDGSPMSSIDMTRSWGQNWGNDTSTDWVSASHDGIISVFSSCFVRITHDSGWATDYYHLDNVQFNNGDEIKAGDFISNYADNLTQAICQGGHSFSPHVHFALVKDGSRHSLSEQALSNWTMHPGMNSYDSLPTRMWLEKNGVKLFAFENTLKHLSGDNEIDYRYSGLYTSAAIDGHGVEVVISKFVNTDSNLNIVFTTLYTYDDNGNTNYYAGSTDFDNWRIDETKIINLKQNSGGDFTNLTPVDRDNDVLEAGTIELHFINCSTLEVYFSLIEPTSNEIVEKNLVLSKIIGTPDYVCEAPSLMP